MKRSLYIFFILFFSFSTFAREASQTPAPYNYYVVIGVFGLHNNAINYTKFAKKLGLDTDYAYHPSRNLYYVYIYYHPIKAEAVKVTLDTRKEQKYLDAHEMFEDTWVFGTDEFHRMSRNLPEPVVTEAEILAAQSASISKEDMEKVRVVEEPTMAEKQAKAAEDAATKKEANDADGNVSNESTPEEDEKPKRREGYYPIYLNTFNGTNLREVEASIDLKDPVRSRLISKLNAHEFMEIQSPNIPGDVSLACEMFGYRTLEHQINLKNPTQGESAAFVDMMNDTIIVNFELVRYRVGDLVTMYNVYFFKDAPVIRPESKPEMMDLLEMLQENENYTIKIHGHTNGSSSGPIIEPEDEEENLFNINGEVKRGSGSAKKLSQARADIMKRWLVQNNIDESRIETKGWGGARKLYDTKGSNADKNVRVEVEILTE